MTNVTVSEITSLSGVIGKKYIVKQAYDLFYRQAHKRIITITNTLPYQTTDTDYFCCHVQIESEHYRTIWYDIIYQFFTTDKITPHTKIRLYSNCPAFVYYLAYVCYRRDALLFAYLYPPQVLTIPPNKTNPHKTLDIDKYSYAALKYILGQRITYQSIGKRASKDWTHIPSCVDVERMITARKIQQRSTRRKRR